MFIVQKKIALLNTGSELVSGDILNINSQMIANLLQNAGFSIGMHMIASDEQVEIEKALKFLLEDHSVVIVTGGLGPTSDDRTRFALSQVCEMPLVLRESSWKRIQDFFKTRNMNCPENNKVQAMFPEKAKLFPNKKGTADACCVSKSGKTIYLLPGPPRELNPIFKDFVLPDLLKLKMHQVIFKASWLLLNISESHMAHEIDEIVPQSETLSLAYRVDYPYLEVKLRAYDQSDYLKYKNEIEAQLKPHLVSRERETTTEQLKKYIKQLQQPIYITDPVTGGVLESRILDADNYPYLCFSHQPFEQNKKSIFFQIENHQAYWKNPSKSLEEINLKVQVFDQNKQRYLEKKHIVPQTQNIRKYISETVAWMILNDLKKHHG
jgi:molybdenum cofactor synthesis domain-containing protein